MLKSFALSLLAAGLIIAPGVAKADSQVQSSVTSTNITTGNSGTRNVTSISSGAATVQNQYKYKSGFCGASNQAQGSVANAGIATANIGIANATGIASSSSTIQSQSGCQKLYP